MKKNGWLPAHEENPSESVFKNVSVNRKDKTHIARFQQEIPKSVIFDHYWDIYKDEIIKKMKVYPVSKVKCTIKIRMWREKLNRDYINDVFPFESEIFIVTDGTDMDKFLTTDF